TTVLPSGRSRAAYEAAAHPKHNSARSSMTKTTCMLWLVAGAILTAAAPSTAQTPPPTQTPPAAQTPQQQTPPPTQTPPPEQTPPPAQTPPPTQTPRTQPKSSSSVTSVPTKNFFIDVNGGVQAASHNIANTSTPTIYA